MSKVYVVKHDGGSYSDYVLSILGITDSCDEALLFAKEAAENMDGSDLIWDDRIFITDYELNKNYKDSTKAELEAYQSRAEDRSVDIYHFEDFSDGKYKRVVNKCPYCGRKLGAD